MCFPKIWGCEDRERCGQPKRLRGQTFNPASLWLVALRLFRLFQRPIVGAKYGGCRGARRRRLPLGAARDVSAFRQFFVQHDPCPQRLASTFRHSEKSFQRWDDLPPFRQVVNPSKLGPPARVVPCTHPWASPLMPHAEHQGIVPDFVLVPDRRSPPPRREKTALERRFPARSPLSVHGQPVHGVECPADAGV